MRSDNNTLSRSEQRPDAVKPELLAPGGSFEGICAAVNAGADAVYAAGTMFGARAYADNPEEDMLLKAIDYCHLHGAKLYMTVNTLLKERELEENLTAFLRPYYEQGVDAVLVQDPGTLRLIRERFPDLPLHASTQMSVQSPDGARLAAALGISRIVPARELTLPEIRQIYEETGMEIECFIHGALCYSYSGQCLMSSLIGGRSGNRGRCAQPCRKRYTLSSVSGVGGFSGGQEQSAQKTGQVIPGMSGRILSDPAAPYLLSLKDICALQVLPELIDAGVASFKIEGRMKRAEYAAGVTAVYRKYIDLYMQRGASGYRVDEEDVRILQDLYNRGGFSNGYYHVTHSPKMMVMDRPNHAGTLAAAYSAARRRESANTGKYKTSGSFTAQETLYPGDMLEAMPSVKDGVSLRVLEKINAGERLSERNVKGISGISAGISPSRGGSGKEAGRRDNRGSSRSNQGGRDNRDQCSDRGNFGMRDQTGNVRVVLRRTHCGKLLSDLEAEWIRKEKQEAISGLFTMRRGEPARLSVSRGQWEAEACGEIPSEALSRPLGEADIIKQLSKTKDTAFTFESLTVQRDDGLFLPLGALNALRRDALEKLERSILESYRRSGDENSAETGVKNPAAETPAPDSSGAGESAEQGGSDTPALSAFVSTGEQLDAVLDFHQIRRIYLDTGMYLDRFMNRPVTIDECGKAGSMAHQAGAAAEDDAQVLREEHRAILDDITRIRAAGRECYLALPTTWRAHVRARFSELFPGSLLKEADGLMLRCLDQVYAFSGMGADAGTDRETIAGSNPIKGCDLITDSNLYVWNRRAISLYKELGIRQVTMPAELNRAELGSVYACGDRSRSENRDQSETRNGRPGDMPEGAPDRGRFRAELTIYGRQGVMLTAQCLRKNTVGCDRTPGVMMLTDERGARFPVLNRCGSCMNEIYNSVPLDLTDLKEEITRTGADSLRFTFTVESKAQVRSVLNRYLQGKAPEGEFTRGHFKRGVE